ncbi:DNA starvation/stationary phase protection protein [Pelagibius sp. 7325]|uniref:Dps family protein n=1 Tax=Pelagibius sp. 7325 TaxID=3131994 RepID=UPI0030EC3EFB
MSSSVLQMKTDVENPETGLENRKRLAGNLTGILADTYLLLVKTQGYHWNVVGPLFVSLHRLTEEQYRDLFEAVDDLAERVRALGHPAPSSITEMIALTQIAEDTGNASAEEMVVNLVADHERIVRRLREAAIMAEEQHDVVTAGMLTDRMAFHEQAVWMLRAVIAGK